MLMFPKKPDSVFLEILRAALEIKRDMIHELAEEVNAEVWREDYPRLARCFTPQSSPSLRRRRTCGVRRKSSAFPGRRELHVDRTVEPPLLGEESQRLLLVPSPMAPPSAVFEGDHSWR